MALPTTKTEYKEYCLRALGKPVIEINVDDDQVEDRVDEAMSYYWDYHFDGTEKIYYKYVVTANTISDRYIPVPENVIGVINLFPMSQVWNTANFFDFRYQFALNDLHNIASSSMVPFVMAMERIQMLEQILVGQKPIRYNRHTDRLYIDMNWDAVVVGSTIVAEAYQVLDPNEYTDVWKDRWFLLYGTCLIKQQWGNNLKKFKGMVMPGGIQFNGQDIYNEATDERQKLESEMLNSFSLPAYDMIGN